MFIHAIEGSWFSHPFVKAGFLLTDADDVAALRSSSVDAVVIDTNKGADIALTPARGDAPDSRGSAAPDASPALRIVSGDDEATTEQAGATPVGTAAAADSVAASAAQDPNAPCSMAEEFARASAIAAQAKQVMTQLYDQARLGKIVEAATLVPLVDDIAGSIARNRSALTSILRMKTKDEYTYVHSVAVAALMINLGREIGGLGDATLRDLGVAGLLHDIGKMSVPAALLGKPGSLTSAEFSVMKTHPERGYELLRRSQGVPEMALDVCLNHHEKVNGSGYPRRLKGAQLTLFARMGAVCDVYDALTSNRPYKTAWTPTQALKEMFSWRGHFDQDILTAFIRSVGIYPVGTLVRLSSGHLGFVIDINAGDLTRPVVRLFHSIAGAGPVPHRDVNLLLDPDGDSILSVEDPDKWGFMDWELQWNALAA